MYVRDTIGMYVRACSPWLTTGGLREREGEAPRGAGAHGPDFVPGLLILSEKRGFFWVEYFSRCRGFCLFDVVWLFVGVST